MNRDISHAQKAVEYFCNNFNCSQSVFATFATEYGIDEELALKLGTDFGGGARMGELCGAVSGALLVLGLRCGHCKCGDTETKQKSYAIASEYMHRFIEKQGSVVCRDLLEYDLSKPEEMEQARQKNLFHTICPQMVMQAVEILDEMIAEGKC